MNSESFRNRQARAEGEEVLISPIVSGRLGH